MDCDQMLALIDHYMDGGLSQWRMRAVTRHLDDCPPCYDGYRLNVSFRQVVASKCTEAAPHNLRLRIAEALSTQIDEWAPDNRPDEGEPFNVRR